MMAMICKVGGSRAAWRRGGRQHLESGCSDATALRAQRHVVVRREGPRTIVRKPHEQVTIAPHAEEERLRLL